MREQSHTVDLCVVGGGLAGMCTAVAAARHGAKVALIQDRPVLGGNASSEIRMWICGAHGENRRETGLVEELHLENNYRNPESSISVWDSVLYQFVRFQPGLELYLNCTVTAATMEENRIASVSAWQMTNETRHTFYAKIFADCSGDSILAPMTGAEWRIGREARFEHNEDIEPEKADRKTMGMSCLLQVREMPHPVKYTPPKWARKFERDEDLPLRDHGFKGTSNFWWIELGGEDDVLHDAEELRDRLLPIVFGVWDHVKNHGDHGAENWTLDWVGFLPGKRESRRYVGDYTLTQNDVRAEGRFDDLIAYGGWTMDDHNPGGFNYPGAPTIFHPAPSPFGIPYRCIYSRNVCNLMFAGRNISVSHAALSATRVMATCATLGQAAGTAAAIAVRNGEMPRDVYDKHIDELKQALMDDDAWLPFNARAVPQLSLEAKLSASEGEPEPLRNGIDRPWDGKENAWSCEKGGYVEYVFSQEKSISLARIVFDSDLNRKGVVEKYNIVSNYPLDLPTRHTPCTLVKAFRIETLDASGKWNVVVREACNYQRLVKVPLNAKAFGVRLVLEDTWGEERCRIFAFDVR